ncbi:MAG: hypothetical protein E7619_06625 [Ruminococcaceae bacterium]|nr:hypothetical protein [Oscillospiraceae bacterium]
MSKRTRLFFRIILVLLCVVWQGFIFELSAESSGGSSARSEGVSEMIVELFTGGKNMTDAEKEALAERIEPPLRTCAHMFCYFVLGALYFLLASTFFGKLVKCTLLSLMGVLIYAIADEVHQYFVPGRSMQMADIFADLFGAAVAAALLCVAFYITRKRR